MWLEPMTNKITNTVAAGAVVSPWWLPSVADVSAAAAQWLPILGILWLIMQMGFALIKFLKGK